MTGMTRYVFKVNRFSRSEDCFDDCDGFGPAHTDHAQSPFPERSGDGGDRVLRRLHYLTSVVSITDEGWLV